MVFYLVRLVALVLGSALVFLGIVGLFLPFLQGFLLILLGLSVLSLVSRRAEGWLRKVTGQIKRLARRRRSTD